MEDYEAEKCIKIAEKAIESEDYQKAKKFLLKSLQIQYNTKAKTLLDKYQQLFNQIEEDELLCDRVINELNFYDILNLPKTAGETQIKQQFITLGTKLKDMKNANKAEEAFKRLAQIYTCLSNKSTRKTYDELSTESNLKESLNDLLKNINPKEALKIAIQEPKQPGCIQLLLLLITFLFISYIKFTNHRFANDYSLERVKPYTEVLNTAGIKYYVTKDFYSISMANVDLVSEVETKVKERYRISIKRQCDTVKKAKRYIDYKLTKGRLDKKERSILERERQSINLTPCNF